MFPAMEREESDRRRSSFQREYRAERRESTKAMEILTGLRVVAEQMSGDFSLAAPIDCKIAALTP